MKSLHSRWRCCLSKSIESARRLRRIRHFHLLPLGRSRHTWRAMSTGSNHEYEDFYRYSSGRWLWDEDEQLRDRYKRFDVSELKKIAAKSVGAQKCTSMTKLAEGGFNKVFRLVMDDNSVVIARIPNPNAGPPFKTTASEVATMDLALNILGIPVPKVLSWSAKADNPVKSEYILMEEARGTRLGETWDMMELQGKLRIVQDVVAIEKKLASLSFSRYGNIYFADDAFEGCEKAEIEGDAPPSLKSEVERRFVIGPVVDKHFWNGQRALMDIDRGPWTHSRGFLKAISQREISWLRHYAKPRSPQGFLPRSEAQCSPEAHIALHEKFLDIIDSLLPSNSELIKSTLWHWDIHASNLFSDGDKVTGLIDWQGAWAGPLFLQVRQPRLVDYNGELMLKLPAHYEDLEDQHERSRVRSQVEKSIVLWAYESDTKDESPLLHEIFHTPQGRTRKQTVEFAADTWDGDIIPFRQCLIRMQRHWNEINTKDPCPIAFSEEEIKAHIRDGEGWNDNADFWASLEGFVHQDGWTSNENFEDAIELFAQLREKGLQDLSGEELLDFESKTRWAARLR